MRELNQAVLGLDQAVIAFMTITHEPTHQHPTRGERERGKERKGEKEKESISTYIETRKPVRLLASTLLQNPPPYKQTLGIGTVTVIEATPLIHTAASNVEHRSKPTNLERSQQVAKAQVISQEQERNNS